jgi:Mor family transcriptional regulator
MTKKELEERIVELEKSIVELERRIKTQKQQSKTFSIEERISALEQDVILLREYNGLTIQELRKLYDISGIQKVLPVEEIDSIKFAVFRRGYSLPQILSSPSPLFCSLNEISEEQTRQLSSQYRESLNHFSETIRRKFIEPKE